MVVCIPVLLLAITPCLSLAVRLLLDLAAGRFAAVVGSCCGGGTHWRILLLTGVLLLRIMDGLHLKLVCGNEMHGGKRGACICAHDQAPVFHDGMKGWSCCKKRSHDFSLFLDIPGCATGKHSSEKPPKPGPSPNRSLIPSVTANKADVKATCSRCRQGFFCQDHTPVPGVKPTPKSVKPVPKEPERPVVPAPVVLSAPVDPFQEQLCKNKGCGRKFREMDNHDTACHYHPGPAIFHDRLRKWVCCDVEVKDFDEFLEVPPCQKGWHNSNPTA
ncbi:hypothetical protein CBR_g32001 [Chara braunii]|uniref:CHORD domain-containing protein n=1 Tax=Chara braunii TaxID=69332 RepID=A0A388LGD6_CHABU|nr:hypothetical protein CBR_g32001 [Chara braunii]|eukprot:GBG81327.1 hypothetical protein CBR_g32001 [Chara braunii]